MIKIILAILLCASTAKAVISTVLNSSESQEIAQTTNFTGVQLVGSHGKYAKSYNLVSQVTVSAPAAGTFTCAASNICTKASHGYKNGLKVQVSTTTTLPGGLSAVTDYYVIYLSASTFSLATSAANALAGTAIDITDAGTGTHTVTPQALAGGNVKLQGSQDGTTYVDLGVSSNITTTANFIFEKVDPTFDYVRAVYTLTGGQISVSQNLLVKGE